ncbi:MAG: hypothetical protein HY403_10415 [Elusimicrobia bacterium]|nr:hypothetical protein [Elusimicrobiota bacterium]
MVKHALLCAALLAASSRAHAGIRLGDAEAEAIGMKIWKNESGGTIDGLTHWNKGENFASLGIGHFIWYKANEPGRFTESFPGLLDALVRSGRTLPAWLQGKPPCPWNDRDDFFSKFRSPRMNELRRLLADSIGVQARYAADRLEAALPKILEAAPSSERPKLQARFERVAAAPNGVYALMDYVNFKGEGVSLAERYNGQGWGLLQVLEGMADASPGQASVEAFAESADAALTRRVANSPPENDEARWLPGWRKRLRTYLEP